MNLRRKEVEETDRKKLNRQIVKDIDKVLNTTKLSGKERKMFEKIKKRHL